MNQETRHTIAKQIAAIPDPEIPVITIEDLGILQKIEINAQGHVHIEITPTYTGCPAMQHIEADIVAVLKANQIVDYTIKQILSPAWTTDWISEEAKEKLRQYGIAPPEKTSANKALLSLKGAAEVKCPQCGSANTVMINQFGSTACKALYKCNSCLEPFDYFKCL